MADTEHRFLSDLVESEDRFARSTNIEFGYRDPDRTPDYKFTTKSLNLLETILDSCQGSSRDRAWTIVGPYGSGKSIFCLLMLQLLSKSQSLWSERSLAQLKSTNPKLAHRVDEEITTSESRYIPVIIQGSRSSFDRALSQALLNAATEEMAYKSWASKKFVKSIQLQIDSIDNGVQDSQATIDLVEQATNLAKQAGHKGLFIVADEFGKFLERAAWQGDISELVTCQYIAEFASGTPDPDLLFLVVLHQGLTSYMTTLTEQQGREWAKVQGRFRAVEFTQNADNLYDLVSASLTQRPSTNGHSKRINDWSKKSWSQVKTFPAFDAPTQETLWGHLLPKVFPLHPITLYALPRLSARLSQNERTMFTFLGSDDPVGFKAFLRRTALDKGELPSLTLDYLFEYFVSGAPYLTLGPEAQKRLSEVDVALERLGDRNSLDTRVVKVIGTLNLLGAGNLLPASEPVIAAALDLSIKRDTARLSETLERLLSRKILVFRKYSDEYKIWQGSDFDFDGIIRETREEIREGFDTAEALQALLNPRPVIARRHSFEHGCTRLFPTTFCDPTEVKSGNEFIKETIQSDIDGLIILTVPGSSTELRAAQQWASKIDDPRVLTVVPSDPVIVQDLALELAALRKIRVSYPELEDDPVALKELAGRIDATEDLLTESLESLGEPSAGGSLWYRQGNTCKLTDRRQLQNLLSDICDAVYSLSPVVLNELINRGSLSSAVVTAVKKIIEALIQDQRQPNLGFSGNGPEISILKALLEKNGLYQPGGKAGPTIKRPSSHTDDGLAAVWKEIERHIKTAVDSARPLHTLYDQVSQPPYGVKKGLIPLFIWIILIHHRRSVSLYENGTFQTVWSVELFDRFIKAPETFTCRWLMYRDATGDLLTQLNKAFPSAPDIHQTRSGTPLSGFLEHLFHWYQELPDYSKYTKTISETAQGLRSVFTSAVDPVELIFISVPKELSLEAWDSESTGTGVDTEKKIAAYAKRFRETVSEIDGAYASLLNEIVVGIAHAFKIKPVLKDVKLFLGALGPEVQGHVRDPLAQAFLVRALDTEVGEEKWLESVGAALAGQAPQFWLAHHLEDFMDKVALVALAIRDARKRAYAVSLIQENDQTLLKRFLVEASDKVLLDSVVSESELSSDVESAAAEMVEILDQTYKELPVEPKLIALIRALEMISTREGDK